VQACHHSHNICFSIVYFTDSLKVSVFINCTIFNSAILIDMFLRLILNHSTKVNALLYSLIVSLISGRE